MKKILLVATVALVALSAGAQGLSAQKSGKAMMQNQPKAVSSVMRVDVQPVPAKAADYQLVQRNKQLKQISISEKDMMGFTFNNSALVPAKVGALQQTYNGSGVDYSTESTVTWEMYQAALEDKTPVLVDVIPNPFGGNGVPVKYTVSDNTVVITPQLVASSESQGMYIFICTQQDNVVLQLDENGAITGKYEILYMVFSTPQYDLSWETAMGYYKRMTNVRYALPGAPEVAPDPTVQPSSNMLFSTVGTSGYSFTNNLAIIPAGAEFVVSNTTSDACTAYKWDMTVPAMYEGQEAQHITSAERDFKLVTEPGSVYSNLSLIAVNGQAESEPVFLGAGVDKEVAYYYAGSTPISFSDIDDTPVAAFFDVNYDMTFYSNFGTPDIDSSNKAVLYSYQGKPAAPLYIESIVLPVGNFTATDKFELHAKIMKCKRGSKLELGEVIAEGDADIETVQTGDFISNIVFPLYVTDADGMSESIDHLFIEDEFVIVIEGFDNGTFSAIIAVYNQDNINAYANNSTSFWFEKTGEPGSMYSYTSWKTACLVGMGEATYGYLTTEDATTIEFNPEKTTATLHIHPMLCSVDPSGVQSTRLMIEDEDAVPSWLSFKIENEDYADSFTFDLVLEAEAGEADEATFVLYQEGAKLPITVKRAASAGISTVAVDNTVETPIFNLMGQKVQKAEGGIFFKNGVKFYAE